ncbi:MAG: hypothetical protein K6A44_06930 [bacterium]|nr:hypothetical protein [bacterium]
MNPIQAEAVRQAIMAQQSGQQPQVVFLKTNPMPYDSYGGQSSGGSFLFKLAAIGTAIIFRKNIANVARRYMPNLSQEIGNVFQGFKGFIKKFKGSDYLAAGWRKYVGFENTAKKFVNDTFSTPTGTMIKDKAVGAWNWLKGLVLKKPPTSP